MKKLILSTFALSVLLGTVSAQNKDVAKKTPVVAKKLDRTKAPASGPAPKIQIGNAEKFVLDNGLTVLLVENHKLPRVSFQLNVEYTPFMENEIAGNSDLAGSLLKTGTTKRSKAQIDEEIDFIGANLSTSGSGIYASSLTKHADKLLEITSDVLLNPTFPVDELEKLRKQTISGIKQEKDDANAIAANVAKVLRYGKNHPYGEITTEETVGKISQGTVKGFYNTYFKPNTSYLVIVGDINRAKAEELAKKYFGSWQKGEVPKSTLPEVKSPEGTQVVFVPKTGAVQSVINVTYPVDFKPGNADNIKASVMNSLLGGGVFSGRLMQNLRENKGYTYGANSSLATNRYTGSFTAFASVRNEVTDSSVTEFLYEMNRLRNEPVTDAEWSRIKNYMNGSFARSLESPQTIANFALNKELYNLNPDYYKNYLSQLSAVSVADVQEMAKKYIKPDNTYVLVVGNKDVADKLKKFDSDKDVTILDNNGNAANLVQMKALPAGVTAQSIYDKAIMAFTNTTDLASANKKLKSLKDIKVTSTGEIQGQGLEITQYKKAPGKFAMEVSFGGQVVQKVSFNGEKGKSAGMQGQKDMGADEIAEYKDMAQFAPEAMYTEANGYKSVAKGIEPINGKDAYVVELTKGTETKTLYFDLTTGMKVRTIQTEEGPQGKMTVVSDVADFKDFEGYKFATSSTLPLGGGMNLNLTVQTVEINKKIADEVFN